jgi:hypothetical protein
MKRKKTILIKYPRFLLALIMSVICVCVYSYQNKEIIVSLVAPKKAFEQKVKNFEEQFTKEELNIEVSTKLQQIDFLNILNLQNINEEYVDHLDALDAKIWLYQKKNKESIFSHIQLIQPKTEQVMLNVLAVCDKEAFYVKTDYMQQWISVDSNAINIYVKVRGFIDTLRRVNAPARKYLLDQNQIEGFIITSPIEAEVRSVKRQLDDPLFDRQNSFDLDQSLLKDWFKH